MTRMLTWARLSVRLLGESLLDDGMLGTATDIIDIMSESLSSDDIMRREIVTA